METIITRVAPGVEFPSIDNTIKYGNGHRETVSDIVEDIKYGDKTFDMILNGIQKQTTKTSGLFGIDTNIIGNLLYDKIGYINSSISKLFETALKIVYDLYQSYIKIKEIVNNDEELNKILSKNEYVNGEEFSYYNNMRNFLINQKKNNVEITETNTMVDFESFVYSIITNYNGSDPFQSVSYYDYMSEVSNLRSKYDEYNTNFIQFDVENSGEFSNSMPTSKFNWNNGLIFKLRPILSDTGKFSEYSDKIDNIICGWKILFDVRSLAISLISASNFCSKSTEELASLTKDEYVNGEISKYTNIIDEYSKLISVSILNQNSYTRENIGKFCDKINRIYDKCLNDPGNRFLIAMLKNKYGDPTGMLSQSLENPFTSATNDYASALDNTSNIIKQNDFYHIDTELTSNIYRDIVDNVENYKFGETTTSQTNHKIIKSISYNIFKHALIHYFEDTVCAIYIKTKESEFHLHEYSREFDAKFDMDSLQTIVSGLDKYLVKDYFRSLLPFISKLSYRTTFSPYNGTKGNECKKDNPSFLYSKYKRLIWIYLFSQMNYLGNLVSYIPSFKDDSELNRGIKHMIRMNIKTIMDLLKTVSSNSGTVINACPINIYDITNKDIFIQKIKYMHDFMNNFIHYPESRICQKKNDELCNIVTKKYTNETGFSDKAVPNCMNGECNLPIVFVGVFLSDDHEIWTDEGIRLNFTIPSIDVIFDNITKLLKNKGLM